MASFDKIQPEILKSEGGYTDNPNDNGNWTGGKKGSGYLIGTKYGISAPLWKKYYGYTTKEQVRNATIEQANYIYKRDFWDKIGGDKIKDEDVAHIIYDMAVNHGIGFAYDVVKKALGISTYSTDAINSADPQELFNKIKKAREEKYRMLAQNPQYSGFLKGWLNRLNKFTYGVFSKIEKTVSAGIKGIKGTSQKNILVFIFIFLALAILIVILIKKHFQKNKKI